MKTSTVLRKARKVLWNGRGEYGYPPDDKTRYICLAIDITDPGLRCGHASPSSRRAKDMIRNLLRQHVCLELWLKANIRGFSTTTWIERDNIKMQNTRKAWLEHLINHYESIGD